MNDQPDNEWFSRRLNALIEQRSKLYRDLEKIQNHYKAGEGSRGKIYQSIQWQIRDLNNAIHSYTSITETLFFEAFYHECCSAIPEVALREITEAARETANKARARLAGVKDLVLDKPTERLNGSLGVVQQVNKPATWKPLRGNPVLKKVPLV